MAMVIPRCRSSGALSIWSKGVKSACPFKASVLVIAAVSVVLPWSTCPMVPTFACGLVRSNRFFAIYCAPFLVTDCCFLVGPGTGNLDLGSRLRQDAGLDVPGDRLVVRELHRGRATALRR